MKRTDQDDETLSRIAHEWRERINAGDATPADRDALAAWLAADVRHEEAFDRAETYWAAYDHLRHEDIERDLMPRAQVGRRVQFLYRARALFATAPKNFALAAAAAAIALIAVSVTFGNVQNERSLPMAGEQILANYETGIAETNVITLSDGTVATLGARTQIEVAMSDRSRTITLKSGAAYFNVVSDAARPFSVDVGELTATAVGTEFDVRNNGGVLRVGVAEGRVEVTYPFMIDDKPTQLVIRRILDPGQEVSATLNQGLRPIRAVAIGNVGAWREQKLIYDGGTLGELVADVNRYSEREIIFTESARVFADQTVTASFDANNVDRVLSMLSLSYPIEIDDSDTGTFRLRAKDADK